MEKSQLNARRYTFTSAGRTGPTKLGPDAWDALVTKSEAGELAAIVERAMHEVDPQTKVPAPQRYVPLDIRNAAGLPTGVSIGNVGTAPEIKRGTVLRATLGFKFGVPSRAAPAFTGGGSMVMKTAQIVAESTGDGTADRPVSPCAVPPGFEAAAGLAGPAAPVPETVSNAPDSSEGEAEAEGEDEGEPMDSRPPTPSPAPSSDGAGVGPFEDAGRRVNAPGGKASKKRSRRATVAAMTGA
jgi:hypothetical protein